MDEHPLPHMKFAFHKRTNSSAADEFQNEFPMGVCSLFTLIGSFSNGNYHEPQKDKCVEALFKYSEMVLKIGVFC
jgi:hypothetical protein